MSCCGQPKAGYTYVWQHRQNGKPVTEHADQAAAMAAQRDAGGKGLVMKVTKRVTTS